MTRVPSIVIAIAALFGGTAASAANVIDQSAYVDSVPMAVFSQTDLAQSFQQTASNISGAGIFLDNYGTSGTITISLWSDLPNAVGAILLASASGGGTAGQWVDVFWTPVSITPDSTYYLAFSSTASDLAIAGDIGNGYSRGMVFANSGYGSFPAYDYTFRTYADNAAPVPEPETYAMLLAGLGVLGFMGKRRKAG